MIRLHPLPDVIHHCPFDEATLEAVGWHIPGMRNLSDLRCPECGREFYGDLPAGQALYTPLLLEKRTGEVYDPEDVRWFADWLRRSYEGRIDEPLGFETEEFRPLKTPLLLNCLDRMYGHSLLKLLNAQYYLDHTPEYDLIVLIPRFLRWMVPDGVAAVWTVDLPLSRGTTWNDGLAKEIRALLERYDQAWLSVAYSHPHPQDFDIKSFTKIEPFPLDEWEVRLERPTVTFIWREDRLWSADDPSNRSRSRTYRVWGRLIGWMSSPLKRQVTRIVLLAESLRERFKDLEFSVAGFGEAGGLPGWIKDLRTRQIDADRERTWCEQYARSHVVLGVHGSNMLLPSAHAGAAVELVPSDRWGNVLQDLLLRPYDARVSVLLYRALPLSIKIPDLSRIVINLLLWQKMGLVLKARFRGE